MIESKIDLTDRLRREKRWEEASRFKDSHAKKLRDGGAKRGEAIQAAWEAMEIEFPPIEKPEPEEDESAEVFSAEELAGPAPGSLKNFVSDTGWVYNNLGFGDTSTEDPPSTGALSLLSWARKNTNDFYGKILPKALQLLEKGPDSAEEAKQEALAHAKSLQDRIGHLVEDNHEEFDRGLIEK